MFVGDTMKNDAEIFIRKLRPSLQIRLRFIAHINIEEITESKEQQQQPPVAVTASTSAVTTAAPVFKPVDNTTS